MFCVLADGARVRVCVYEGGYPCRMSPGEAMPQRGNSAKAPLSPVLPRVLRKGRSTLRQSPCGFVLIKGNGMHNGGGVCGERAAVFSSSNGGRAGASGLDDGPHGSDVNSIFSYQCGLISDSFDISLTGSFQRNAEGW